MLFRSVVHIEANFVKQIFASDHIAVQTAVSEIGTKSFHLIQRLVDGIDTSKEPELWKVRQKAGMVFQNPDNQIIGTVVEEDVGFGPENMGVPTEKIWERVDESLKKTGMTSYRYHSPNKLSGGQKQRVAIAGVMAMRPKCIILD